MCIVYRKNVKLQKKCAGVFFRPYHASVWTYEYALEVIVQVNLKSQNYIDKPGVQNQLYSLNMTYFKCKDDLGCQATYWIDIKIDANMKIDRYYILVGGFKFVHRKDQAFSPRKKDNK